MTARVVVRTGCALQSAFSWQLAKRRLVRPTVTLSGEHGVIDREDALFSAIATVNLFIFLSHNRELIEDTSHGIARLWEVMIERH
jgi:hypothetical protein